MRIYDEANTTNASLQPFKYNGKELDMMHGLNTYDYGARQYYSALPVWDRVDPLAEKYRETSPYVYCTNNPVNKFDPDGRDGVATVDVNNKTIVITQNFYYNSSNPGFRSNFITETSPRVDYLSDVDINSSTGWARPEGFDVDGWHVTFEQKFIACESDDAVSEAMENDVTGNALVFDNDLKDYPGQYEPSSRTIRLGPNSFTPNHKGQTLKHEIGHSWGLEHDYEMGIQMPANDLLGKYAENGGMMTSALQRDILNEEILYGIKPIIETANSVKKNNVSINIFIANGKKYEVR